MVKSLHVMNQALRHAPGHQSLLRDAYSMHSLQYVEQTVRAFSDQLSNDPGSAWSILHPLLSPPAIRPRVAGNTPHERIAAFHAHFSNLFAPPPPAPPLPAAQLPRGINFRTGSFSEKECVQEAVTALGNGKSSGLDSIPNEVL